jgi:hypothetical protein
MKKLFVIFAAVALVAAFAVSASAAEWSLYGNARMATYLTDQDFGDTTFNNSFGHNDDEDLEWDLQSNSRVGANIKGDNIKAQVELGLKGSTGDTDVGTRRVYGVYDFGSWKLKIGKDYTPISQFISGQVYDGDLGLLGTGTQYGSRKGQLSATFGNFEVALISPKSTAISGLAGDVDETLPAIEAKWGMSSDMWSFNIRGGYQTYEIEVAAASTLSDEDIDSTVIAVDGSINFGPIKVSAAVSQGTNIGVAWFDYSQSDPSPSFFGIKPGVPIFVGTDLKEVDTLMYALVVNFKSSDTLSFEAGVGFKEDDMDDIISGGAFQQEDDQMAWYVQAVIQVAPGVFIIPEVGAFDFGDTLIDIPNGGDSGDFTYYGAKWQINF